MLLGVLCIYIWEINLNHNDATLKRYIQKYSFIAPFEKVTVNGSNESYRIVYETSEGIWINDQLKPYDLVSCILCYYNTSIIEDTTFTMVNMYANNSQYIATKIKVFTTVPIGTSTEIDFAIYYI